MGVSFAQAVREREADRRCDLRVTRVVGVDAVGEPLACNERSPRDEEEASVAARLPLANYRLEGGAEIRERRAEPVAL